MKNLMILTSLLIAGMELNAQTVQDTAQIYEFKSFPFINMERLGSGEEMLKADSSVTVREGNNDIKVDFITNSNGVLTNIIAYQKLEGASDYSALSFHAAYNYKSKGTYTTIANFNPSTEPVRYVGFSALRSSTPSNPTTTSTLVRVTRSAEALSLCGL